MWAKYYRQRYVVQNANTEKIRTQIKPKAKYTRPLAPLKRE